MTEPGPGPSEVTGRQALPGGDSETAELAARVVAAALRAGRTLACAESLTGGLVAATITGVPGASAVFRGGLVTYATDLKASLGGVDADDLAKHGAVSEQTAEQLAAGAAARCAAQLAVALTGVAGPSEQEGHPAGTVFLGWYAAALGPDGDPRTGAELLRLHGERDQIRRGAVTAALHRWLELLED